MKYRYLNIINQKTKKVILENKTRKGVILWNDQGECKLEIFDKDDDRIFFEQRELFLEEDFYYICNRMVYVLYNKVYRVIDNNTMEIEHPIVVRIICWIGLPILLAISIRLFSELFVNERYLDFFAIISFHSFPFLSDTWLFMVS